MTEPATCSELNQVLDAIQGMQVIIQAIDKKLDIHIATTTERFNLMDEKLKRLEDKIDAVEAKLEQRINSIEIQLGQRIDTVESTLQDIAKRQAGTDARLWGFLVTLLVATLGLLAKLLLFDLPSS
ncbi:MAG: hypothetical protein ACK4K5_02390 [Thermosynechococcus sp.]|uniref:hypothetical protein n=1 Tax=Thermosynechococcus sp. TaxID=2814275 RepID=UPI0039191B8B